MDSTFNAFEGLTRTHIGLLMDSPFSVALEFLSRVCEPKTSAANLPLVTNIENAQQAAEALKRVA